MVPPERGDAARGGPGTRSRATSREAAKSAITDLSETDPIPEKIATESPQDQAEAATPAPETPPAEAEAHPRLTHDVRTHAESDLDKDSDSEEEVEADPPLINEGKDRTLDTRPDSTHQDDGNEEPHVRTN